MTCIDLLLLILIGGPSTSFMMTPRGSSVYIVKPASFTAKGRAIKHRNRDLNMESDQDVFTSGKVL